MEGVKWLLVLCAFFVISHQQVIPPTNPYIYYNGRTQVGTNGEVVFDWPGVEFTFYFTGAYSVDLILEELMPTIDHSTITASFLNIFLDGNLVNIFSLNSDNSTYEVVHGITDSNTHQLLVTKRTEPLAGVVAFKGIVLGSKGSLVPSPTPLPSRKIEFIGDSITCGYGNEGLSGCGYTVPTQNNYNTYEGIISRTLDAQLYVEAWSGKGVIRNCCYQNITTPNPLPSYYTFSVANSATSKWNFTSWVPDAIVINLGTNDYSTPPQPPEDLFVTAYITFIQTIQKYYAPATPTFFLVCGPMIGDPCCQYVQEVAAKTSATYVDLQGILISPYDYGCAGHPSVSGHYKMALKALPIIQSTMKWNTTEI